MTHQPTLDALAAARYWLEAHPDLPTPTCVRVCPTDTLEQVELAWHLADDHDTALAVLRALADWPWTSAPNVPGTTCYTLRAGGIVLRVYAASTAAPSAPVNLLDALAEVA